MTAYEARELALGVNLCNIFARIIRAAENYRFSVNIDDFEISWQERECLVARGFKVKDVFTSIEISW